MTIKDLQPSVVWNNFYGLTRIPRPSKHEGRAIEYLLEWGRKHNVETFRDATGNVIFRKPATPGYENRKGVIFQGHMDMVPQKVASSAHDFENDPIETEIVGEWVAAKGTTLGADNGIGVALALSILESDDIPHGPLEVLVTYDEETGMTGANSLEPNVLKGDILINLDSEEEGELCIGCAGGLDVVAEFKYEKKPSPTGFCGLRMGVRGLQGGHSGMDISLYRGNANKILTRSLLPLLEDYGVKLADFRGGSLRNAIPFEAEACLVLPADNLQAAEEVAAKYFEESRETYKESDPDMEYFIKECAPSATYIEDSVALNALKSIAVVPSGVIRMSRSMPGLTETSINLAIVGCKDGVIKIASLMRSALDSSKDELARRVRYMYEYAGATVSFNGGYSGWLPKPDLEINRIMTETYRKLFGREMKVFATHGGLECAIMGAKYPNWEMTSIGPTIVHPHSPDERLKISTVAEVWNYLKEVLANIPAKD